MARNEFIYRQQKWPSKGVGVCRICGKEHGDRRSHVCRECRPIYEAIPFSWNDVRYRVFQRDEGVCSSCGCNTVLLERILRRVQSWEYFTGRCTHAHLTSSELRFRSVRYKALDAIMGPVTGRYALWDAHHKNEVAKHGPAESIDEIVTLCIACHKAEHGKKTEVVADLAQGDMFRA